jgi:hypothetical protein
MYRGLFTRLARSVVLVAVLGAIIVPAAFAQSSSVSGYGGEGGEAVGATQSNDPTDPTNPTRSTTSTNDAGVLPFTGLDVGFLLGGGLLLVAVGAGLARFRPHGEIT